MNNPKTTIVIPAYNEEGAIRDTIEKMVGAGMHEKYEIIFIDDGSTDSTADIIKEFPVKLYSHSFNKGYGAALKTGIRKAKGEKVIVMDSDGQHDPAYLKTIDNMLEENDLVIGERTADSHHVANRTLGKRLIRRMGEFLVEQKLPDFNSGLRGFRREHIYQMLHMMPNGFSFSTTSTLAFLKEGLDVATFPVEVTERLGRKSNVKFFKDGTKTMLLLFRIIMLFNPLKIFFPASISIFLAGMAFGTYGFFRFGRFSNSAVILVILGMFLFFIGLLADQISIMNRRKN
jgi:glycosyltransferase involved in cell wall biosynthesis